MMNSNLEQIQERQRVRARIVSLATVVCLTAAMYRDRFCGKYGHRAWLPANREDDAKIHRVAGSGRHWLQCC